jgi:hypothetical protein
VPKQGKEGQEEKSLNSMEGQKMEQRKGGKEGE